MSYPKRLTHKDTGTEIEAHSPEQEAVYAESGWFPAPDLPEPRPGYAPEPITYVQDEDGEYHPEQPEPEPEPEPEPAKPRRRTAKAAED